MVGEVSCKELGKLLVEGRDLFGKDRTKERSKGGGLGEGGR